MPTHANVIRLAIVASLVAAAGTTPGRAQRGEIRRAAEPVPGKYIVVLREGDDPAALSSETALLHRGRVEHVYRRALRGFAAELTEDAARALASDPRVAFVEEDGVVYASAITQASPQNWGLDRVDQRSRTLNGRYRYDATGAGVHAYLLDSGLRLTHDEFGGRASGAFTAIDDGLGTADCNGHGTHVAGILAGSVSGVAKRATLHAVRVLGCDGTGTWSGVTAGIDWITENHVKPAVANMSINGGLSNAANLAVRRAVAAGVVFVASAGNNSQDACLESPGPVAEALIAGATGRTDVRPSWSNFGGCVDMFAPGEDIVSASAAGDPYLVESSGTSMASPHIAGAAALYLQRRPSASPAQVAQALVSSATTGTVVDAGSGSPNRFLYMAYVADRTLPSVRVSAPLAGALVSGSVTLSAQASDDVSLASVSFFVDDRLIATDSSSPYSVTWNTTAHADGSRVLRARATDRGGNAATSAGVTVTVRNAAQPVPAPWVAADVGAVGIAGRASFSSGTFTLLTGGRDIWERADAFHFVHRPWTGDAELVARVTSLQEPAGASFTMGGIMFRESLAANARHVAMVISSEGKGKLRRRTAVGGVTASDGPSAGTTFPPRWVRMLRRGDTFTAFISNDGGAWTRVHLPVTIALPDRVHVGLFALRNGGDALARTTFTNVVVR